MSENYTGEVRFELTKKEIDLNDFCSQLTQYLLVLLLGTKPSHSGHQRLSPLHHSGDPLPSLLLAGAIPTFYYWVRTSDKGIT